MTFQLAQEMPDSPKSNFGVNKRTFTRTYRAWSNDINDGTALANLAPGIPQMYTAYAFGNEHDAYALVREVTSKRVLPGSLCWIITVTYETPDADKSGSESGGTKTEKQEAFANPLLQLPEASMSGETYQEVIFYIYNVNNGQLEPCKNDAGQVFDPPPARDRTRHILKITRNEPLTALHPSIDIVYADAVNSDAFWLALPGQAKMKPITTTRETKQLPNGTQFPYLRVTYTIEFRDTWDLRILNAGAYYLNDDLPPKRIAFKTDDGHPRVGLLNAEGGALADGATPIYLTFRPYNRLPFGALGLPQSFTQVA